MIFRCPCGFINQLDALPEDRRVTCGGCRKTWVVSKSARRKRRLVRNGYMGAAASCVLVPAMWPMSPILLVVLLGRLPLLKHRHWQLARIGLAALTPVILGLAGAMILALGMWATAWLGRTHPTEMQRAGEFSILSRTLLDQWWLVGWAAFAVLVVFTAIVPFVASRVEGAWFDNGQKIFLGALAIIAALGPFALFAHTSLDGPAAAMEQKVQDRYVAATWRDRVQKRWAMLADSVSARLEAGVPDADVQAFAANLTTASSAGVLARMAEQYLEGPGYASATGGPGASGATTQPGGADHEMPDVLWHAMTLSLWEQEQRRAADEEASAARADALRAAATDALERAAAGALHLSLAQREPAIKTYFDDTIDFAIEHFPAATVERSKAAIAAAICQAGAARDLNIRETVASLYQQAVVTNTIEPWQPHSQAGAEIGKVIHIKNDSAETVTFWAVGPVVKEVAIPPATERDVNLDESNYQAVVGIKGQMPCVMELNYGAGLLSGEFTKQGTWVSQHR